MATPIAILAINELHFRHFVVNIMFNFIDCKY